MQPKLLTQIPEHRVARYPDRALITEWEGALAWTCTPVDLCTRIERFKRALHVAQIFAGQRVCVQSDSGRLDILAVEFALMQVGVVVCPIHTHQPAESLQAIVALVDPAAIIVMDDDGREIVVSRLARDQPIVILTIAELDQQVTSEIVSNDPEPNDVALIIFTSGTTGAPKGVMLTHESILSNVLGALSVLPVTFRDTVVSFLPISHVFERIVVYAYLTAGVHLHFTSSPRQVRNLFPVVRPHYVTAVPRILERVYHAFLAAAERRDFFRHQLIRWVLTQSESGTAFGKILARRVVLSRFRRFFGKRLKGIVVGGAAMDPAIIRLFDLAGIAVREGYGLSETGGVVSVNRFEPGGTMIGTVGIPLPGVEVRIVHKDTSGAGDILVRSKGNMLGYFDNPDETQRVLDPAGWLQTGDVGSFVQDRFLKITSRAKEIFKNSFGEYVVPVRVEALLVRSPFIDRAVAIGFQRPFTAALIRPDFVFLQQWCEQHGVHWTAPMYMVHNTRVLQQYQDIIDKVNLQLPKHEQVKRFRLVHEEWTVSDGLLTPSLKLRRVQLERRFEKIISDLYK